MEAFYAELNETKAAAPSSYSATGEFLRYIYFVLVAKNYQKIRTKCLVHEFSLTDIFLNSVLYDCSFLLLLCFFLLVCRAMRTAIVLYLLKYFNSFSAAELNNTESEDEVFVWEFSCEESDYGSSDDENTEQLCIRQAK